MMRRIQSGPNVVGVAIAADRIVVDPRDGSAQRSFPIAVVGGADSFAELTTAVADALRETRAAIGAAHTSITVALMPPLAQCRLIDMPGLSDDEVGRVLSRDVASYFPVGATPHVVGTRKLHRSSGAPSLFATAALSAAVDAIYDAAAATGCSVTAIVPAAAAWVVAAERVWAPSTVGGDLIVVQDERVDVLTIVRGRLVALRRHRGVDAGHKSVVDALAKDGQVILVGEPRLADPLAESLAASGTCLIPTAYDLSRVGAPVALAAAFAPDATAGPFLLPEQVRAVRHHRARRRSLQTIVASAVLFIGAAALELFGVQRELAAVIGQRAAMRDELVAVLARRDTVALLGERVAALRSAEATAPRWSDAVALVAAYLPRGAHLLSLRAEGDSLLLDGVAHRAAPVLEAMTKAPAALTVRAQGSIRQEFREDVGQVERFTLLVRFAGGAP